MEHTRRRRRIAARVHCRYSVTEVNDSTQMTESVATGMLRSDFPPIRCPYSSSPRACFGMSSGKRDHATTFPRRLCSTSHLNCSAGATAGGASQPRKLCMKRRTMVRPSWEISQRAMRSTSMSSASFASHSSRSGTTRAAGRWTKASDSSTRKDSNARDSIGSRRAGELVNCRVRKPDRVELMLERRPTRSCPHA